MTQQPTVAVLDGLPPGPFADAVERGAGQVGSLGAVHHLGAEVFAPCQGCWQCWVREPGACKANDAANDVMRAIVGSDIMLLTTRPRFGCWSAVTKAALDKSIGLISPFFSKVHGETHHRARYDRYPRWGVLAVTDRNTSIEDKARFQRLVARNGLNLHAEATWVGFADDNADATTVADTVRDGLRALATTDPSPFPESPPYRPRTDAVGVPAPSDRTRHAVVWVGSAKPNGTSTSESLGQYLADQLKARGWTTETVHASRLVRLGRDRAPALVDAFRRADLMIVGAPVYVDCPPALVLNGLDLLARADLGPRRPALLPIVQCGFPELSHTSLALEVFAAAARAMRVPWAGHLAVGGGGVIDGRPLSDVGAAHHQVSALQAAAAELDAGLPVSPETTAAFAETVLPPWLYRLTGTAGWIFAAAKHGSVHKLWQKPFAT